MQTSDDVIAMLRDSAADFLAGRHDLQTLKGAIGQPRGIDRQRWQEMAGLGWVGLALPERLGGVDMGLPEASALCELFGRRLFPEPFIAAALIPGILLAACEESAALHPLASGLAEGERLLTLAWQETAGELEVFLPRTRFENGCVSGRKTWVPAAEADSILLVTARSGDELVVVTVAADAPGVRAERLATGSGSLTRFEFDSAPVLYPAPLLSASAARQALRSALDAATVAASAQLSGMAAGCLERTLEYVCSRVQFGRPIGSFQSIQHRCVDLWIATQLADASWSHALGCHQAAPGAVGNASSISAAKARCGDTALQVAKAAVQMYGAMGFTDEVEIGLYLRSALQYSAWLGTPLFQRRRFLASRKLGAGHA